ncbi:EexN family lipoprotein [Falsiroseomonas tokyonensis]|uniref:EexN family lipoprotein n=1 Tax=Falsiroseomonas tokyonensis TaxID=430521 RepID=A0ABV7C660_9PROT|nr:EexN family lipoprotein [Falsiroseomonas tokyonensis]
MTPRRYVAPWCRAPRLLDPDLLGGLGLLLWTLAFLALSAALGVAQPLPPQERRTVSWYAANPWALDAVTRACRDDPGRLRGTSDCINADQARIVVAEREARARAGMRPEAPAATPDSERARQAEAEARRNRGDLTSPTSPRYWVARPMERAQQLAHCGRLTPQQQARFYCDAARAAEAEARRPRS